MLNKMNNSRVLRQSALVGRSASPSELTAFARVQGLLMFTAPYRVHLFTRPTWQAFWLDLIQNVLHKSSNCYQVVDFFVIVFWTSWKQRCSLIWAGKILIPKLCKTACVLTKDHNHYGEDLLTRSFLYRSIFKWRKIDGKKTIKETVPFIP